MRDDIEIQTQSELGHATATSSAKRTLDSYYRPDEFPPIVYHYTSAHGLLEIFRTAKIFATNVGYLNDSSEYVFAHQLFEARIRQFSEESRDDDDARYLSHLVEGLSRVDTVGAGLYVVSFSADGDVLSQWRAYCPPGGGYSIGFKPEDLLEAAKTKVGLFPGEWRLVKCEYDGETQISLIDEAIRSNLEAFRFAEASHDGAISKYCRREIETPPRELQDLQLDIRRAVEELAPVLKHSAFAQEREWRLVSPRVIDGDPCIQFRTSETCVIPHILFSLPGGDQASFADVVVGPAPNQELARQSVFRLCGSPIPNASRIPYRQMR